MVNSALQTGEPTTGLPASAQMRIALICDLVEEKWPSMDLVAEMLAEQLGAGHFPDLSVERLCPAMVRRFTRLGGRRTLWNADRLLNRFVDYPRWLRPRAGSFDLFHLVDHSYAQLAHELPPERTVVTCHDLDAFRCLLDPEAEKRPRWFRAMMTRVFQGLQKSAHLITVSQVVRDQLLEYGIAPPERISVIPNGVHPSCSPAPDCAADAEAARLLPADAAGAIWLLNVGSTIPRKRMDVLLHLLAAVREELPQVRLMRVGGAWTPAQAQLARELRVEEAVTVLPFLTRPVLAAIYRRADLLVHTADAEGFGLPIIEAQACGCPVAATALPVLRDVGGAAAAYVPHSDLAAWTRTVVQLVREKKVAGPEWQTRRNQGLGNASRFSWAAAAARTVDTYQSVLERARHSCPSAGPGFVAEV